MMTRNGFRGLVAVSFVLSLLAGVLSQRTDGLPPALAEYVSNPPPLSTFELSVGSGFLLVSIVTFVGLLAYWPPARPLYVASFVAALALAPFLGPTVQSPVASTLQSAGLVLSGITIALLYLPPVSHEFGQRAERKPS
jgi:hypothetical protein